MADEQTGDDASGATMARGRAELAIAGRPISGKADTIEVRPATNEIVFSGHAFVRVGPATYDNDAVMCTLDFARCGAMATESGAGQSAADAAVSAASTPR